MPTRRFLLVASLALPALARSALPPSIGRPRRIGLLSPAPLAASKSGPYAAFRKGLTDLGYVEGRDYTLELRFTDGVFSELPQRAIELANLPVDIIVTDGGPASVGAAKAATSTIPIVSCTFIGDPVASGLVDSMAHPGGNLTGFVFRPSNLAGKQLQLLKEAIPNLARVAVLSDASDPMNGPFAFREASAAAQSLDLKLISLPIRGAADVEPAFKTAKAEHADAVLQLASRMLFDHRKLIAGLSVANGLPGMYELGYEDVDALLSYGPSVLDNFRHAAVYVDKIFKGARAGDLPIEQADTYYFLVNLRVAKMLGISIPGSVLLQASRVIE